jgi:hypothetical protein
MNLDVGASCCLHWTKHAALVHNAQSLLPLVLLLLPLLHVCRHQLLRLLWKRRTSLTSYCRAVACTYCCCRRQVLLTVANRVAKWSPPFFLRVFLDQQAATNGSAAGAAAAALKVAAVSMSALCSNLSDQPTATAASIAGCRRKVLQTASKQEATWILPAFSGN